MRKPNVVKSPSPEEETNFQKLSERASDWGSPSPDPEGDGRFDITAGDNNDDKQGGGGGNQNNMLEGRREETSRFSWKSHFSFVNSTLSVYRAQLFQTKGPTQSTKHPNVSTNWPLWHNGPYSSIIFQKNDKWIIHKMVSSLVVQVRAADLFLKILAVFFNVLPVYQFNRPLTIFFFEDQPNQKNVELSERLAMSPKRVPKMWDASPQQILAFTANITTSRCSVAKNFKKWSQEWPFQTSNHTMPNYFQRHGPFINL